MLLSFSIGFIQTTSFLELELVCTDGTVEWRKFQSGGISTPLADYTYYVLNSELLFSYLEWENSHALEMPTWNDRDRATGNHHWLLLFSAIGKMLLFSVCVASEKRQYFEYTVNSACFSKCMRPQRLKFI